MTKVVPLPIDSKEDTQQSPVESTAIVAKANTAIASANLIKGEEMKSEGSPNSPHIKPSLKPSNVKINISPANKIRDNE